jgi:hypothetical protein
VQIGTAVWGDPATQSVTYVGDQARERRRARAAARSYDNTASFATAANADTATADRAPCASAPTSYGHQDRDRLSYDTTYAWDRRQDHPRLHRRRSPAAPT